MPRYVALLRAVNLGAKRKVPMADLRALLGELGLENVRTYVQSGNAIFDSGEQPDALKTTLEDRLQATFGFEIPVVLRTRAEIAAVVAADPLGDVADEPKRYHVLFLDGVLDRTRLADFDPAAVAPEVVHLGDREIYVWSPEGVRSSKAFTAVGDRRIGVAATARNWRTVTTLLELMDEPPA